jgi:acyl-CoA-binding protein
MPSFSDKALPPWAVKAGLILLAVGAASGAKLAFRNASASSTEAVEDFSSVDVDVDPFAAGVLWAKRKLQGSKLSIAEKLALYAFYKQAVEGDCNIKEVPSLADMAARAKYDAWMKCKGMPQDVAKQKYLEQVESLSPGWREKVRAGAGAAKDGAAEEEQQKGSSGEMGFSHTSRPTTYLETAEKESEEEEEDEDHAGDEEQPEAGSGHTEGQAASTPALTVSTKAGSYTRSFLNAFSDAIMDGNESVVRETLEKEKAKEEQALLVQSPPAAGIRSSGGRRNILSNQPLNSASERPLHLAVDAGHPSIVSLLLSFGADPTLTENEGGSTPLHYAVSLERYEELEVLLRKTLSAASSSSSTSPASGGVDEGFPKKKLHMGEDDDFEEEAKGNSHGASGGGGASRLVQELSPKAWARHLLFELENDDGDTVWSLACEEESKEAAAVIKKVCSGLFPEGALTFPA